MNFIVKTLAPLDDALVEEITEHERGQCQVPHETILPCTVAAVAVTDFICDDDPAFLSCQNVADWVLAGIAADEDCDECGRPCSECWSVVMLP